MSNHHLVAQPLTGAHDTATTVADRPSDAALVDEVAATIATPRARAADSFVLHAPLELLARAALLTMVDPTARDAARDRLRSLRDSFRAWGPAADGRSSGPTAFDDESVALATLRAAIARGELDDADDAATWLAAHLDADDLRQALADPVLPLLSAAGHGSIFLYHLPRVAPRSADAARMLRSLVRELARNPGWDLSWFRDLPAPPSSAGDGASRELQRRLSAPPSPGDPGSDFIFPMMSVTERSGLAAAVLGDLVGRLSLADARRALLRTAARSMLQDDPAHAPYGWSHCLTMPQAALGVARGCAEPEHAVAVAATYVLAFRSIHGAVALDPEWSPEPPATTDPSVVAHGTPHEAAAVAWHTAPDRRAALVAQLAARASAHHDAHLAKHTLACVDAAHADPPAAPLFLAAAAYLSAWWSAADDAPAPG